MGSGNLSPRTMQKVLGCILIVAVLVMSKKIMVQYTV